MQDNSIAGGEKMKYRKFGKLDWAASVLGFGAMRLPLLDAGNMASVDEAETIRMVRYAIDHGVNYVDTAYPYHGGNSERTVGKALQGGYRGKVKLATKLPAFNVKSLEDCDRILGEQLERLQTNIDFYLLHGMNKGLWTKLRDLNVLRWAERALSDGRIGHLGFSFHDDFDVFKEIVDAYDNWTMCQIQYNYMDIEYQAGTRGLKYAASKGLAVVVMEPIRGGNLSKEPTPQVSQLWASAPRKRTPAEWALLWVWNHPEVSVVLSGMSTMQQVVENVATADSSGANSLSSDEVALIDRVRDAYQNLAPIPCTGCRYCMPCENGVDISRFFELYNNAMMYGEAQRARSFYRGFPGRRAPPQADSCKKCGECVKACPQGIDVPDWLEKVHAFLKPKE